MVSGGFRPKAAQNNPANVKAGGGNGQSGDYKGFGYGQNKALNDTRKLGNAAVASINTASSTPRVEAPTLPAPTSITATSENPNEDVLNGLSPLGQANNFSGLPMPQHEDPDLTAIRNYFPIIEFWASQPGASQGTKDYAAYLGTII